LETDAVDKIGQRDLRIDFFRGLALIFIFIDHVPGNKLSNFTLRNFGFADAAEVFVLLAGFSAVLAYGRTFDTQGFQAGSARVLHRARDVYVWHLGLLLLCGFGLTLAAHVLAQPDYVSGLKLQLFAQEPLRAMALGTVLVNQPDLLNILPLYVMLLLVWVPLMLWLVPRAPAAAVTLSVGIWAIANLYSLNLPSHQHPEGWVFNPFAWQLLITIGVVAARYTLRHRVPVIPALALLAAAYLAFAFLFAAPWTLIPGFESYRIFPQDALGSLDRIYLPVWRLLNILALGYLVLALVSADGRWLRHPWATAIGNCGRHSLQIFCLATVLCLVGWVFLMEVAGNGIGAQMVVNVGGIALLLATAWMLSERKRAQTVLVSTRRPLASEPLQSA
jgi:hypothetical protein